MGDWVVRALPVSPADHVVAAGGAPFGYSGGGVASRPSRHRGGHRHTAVARGHVARRAVFPDRAIGHASVAAIERPTSVSIRTTQLIRSPVNHEVTMITKAHSDRVRRIATPSRIGLNHAVRASSWPSCLCGESSRRVSSDGVKAHRSMWWISAQVLPGRRAGSLPWWDVDWPTRRRTRNRRLCPRRRRAR
jgi:hypothetical protein